MIAKIATLKNFLVSPWKRLLLLMIFYNFPSFILSFLTNKNVIFSNANSANNIFAKFVDMVFLYRPFPDPFVVSIDILVLVFLSSFLYFKKYNRVFAFFISCLFLYQWYSYFVIFFLNKAPSFDQDWYYLFQITKVLDVHIVMMLIIFFIVISVSTICFYRFFKYFIQLNFDNTFKVRLFILLFIFISWSSFLYVSYMDDKKIRYLTVVQCTFFNFLDNFYAFNDKANDITEDASVKLFQKLDYDHSIYFGNNKPNVFVMIIESYGDLNLILSQKNRIYFNDFSSKINTYLDSIGVYSISSYSRHSNNGTFGNFNSIIFGDTFSVNQLRDINSQHIASNTFDKYSVFDFFNSNGYETIGLLPSLSYKSFSSFNYSASQYSSFYDMDYFYIGTDVHNIDHAKVSFLYSNEAFLDHAFKLVNVESHRNYFFTYISSNSHYPYHTFQLDEKTLSEKDFDLSLITRLDRRLRFEQNKMNFTLLKSYLKDTILWDALKFCYDNILLSIQHFKINDRYKDSIKYQYHTMLDVVEQLNHKSFVLIVVGDHQPHFSNYSSITPIHVLSNDTHYLSTWLSHSSFTTGFHLNEVDPVELSHDQIPQLLIDSFKVDNL